ncbi:hypothetical protein GBF38_002930 [Nibea albiflora]|uniref:Uncharacterized protein n=1 Tax=Nibea albiflora TaxID=240163 RepID=A0ACB7FK08_NIBAL|nr:hypothetical protein GBF38_002930 [Nibea albiflora]
MEIVVLKMLFIASVSAQYGKHVYVQKAMLWSDAQNYCRNHHTDLSVITTKWDEQKLQSEVYGTIYGRVWIGLYLNEEHWMWSGGGNATNVPWAYGEPNDLLTQKYGAICCGCTWHGWVNLPYWYQKPFFCFSLIVVEEKRTWENAFSYCNNKHTALTSLASETEHLLALREIQQDHITERVWIGLRYLADRWMWMDGHPSVYRAWDKEDQDHQCPLRKRCTALTKGGVWESWDCKDQLHFICY